jgi:hypothetical protein
MRSRRGHGFYGWVIVAVGALMTLRRDWRNVLARGLPATDVRDTGWSRAGISSAMTPDF